MVGWSHAATENPQGSQQIFVNGQHFSGTAFELDGTDNQDPILGIIVVNPNLDAIQETKIDLQNYDAEFGKALGGVVTVQTKSGSNDFHGKASGSAERMRPLRAILSLNTRLIPSRANSYHTISGSSSAALSAAPSSRTSCFSSATIRPRENQTEPPTFSPFQRRLWLSTCNPATNGTSATPGFCDLHEYLGVEQRGKRNRHHPCGTGRPSLSTGSW